MRPQYHFRNSDQGLLAWDIRKLVAKTMHLQAIEIPLSDLQELDENYWYDLEGDAPTCRSVAEHARIIEETDLSYPIILAPDGRLMDGMHRVCKALNRGMKSIMAYKLPEMPEPDFVGIPPRELPYEE